MSVSYFVRYDITTKDTAEFLRYFRDVHVPLVTRWPGLKGGGLHTPIEWNDPYAITRGNSVLLVQFEVDSAAALSRALFLPEGPKPRLDGYTLLMGGNSRLALNVGLYSKLPYDPVRDFEPISRVATQPNLLAAHPTVPVKSVAELIQYAKANPGKLTYGSNGNGSPQHLAAELLKRMAGIDILPLPHKSAAPMSAALLAGEVSLAFNIILLPLPHVQSGRLTGLAVASSKRSPLAPGLATMSELGYPIDIDTWYGLLAAAGTPKEIVARLSAETARIAGLPELTEGTRSQGIELAATRPDEFGAFMRADIARWTKAIRELRITAD